MAFAADQPLTEESRAVAAAAAAVAWASRTRADADPRLLFALLVSCLITAVPYLLVYDTLALSLAALLLLDGNRLDRTGAWLARPVYWLPLLQIGLGQLDIPGPGFIAPCSRSTSYSGCARRPGRH